MVRHSVCFAGVLAVSAVVLGACGGVDPCEQARQHLAACLGTPATATAQPVACSAEEARRSESLLGLDCTQLQTAGKADGWAQQKHVTVDEAICDPTDPTDRCEAFCSQVRVEYQIFGLRFPGCLVSSSCKLATDAPAMGHCQCRFLPGACSQESDGR